MTDQAKPPPHLTEAGAAAARRRDERRAAALRANLGRRKAQSRGREAAEPPARGPQEEV